MDDEPNPDVTILFSDILDDHNIGHEELALMRLHIGGLIQAMQGSEEAEE